MTFFVVAIFVTSHFSSLTLDVWPLELLRPLISEAESYPPSWQQFDSFDPQHHTAFLSPLFARTSESWNRWVDGKVKLGVQTQRYEKMTSSDWANMHPFHENWAGNFSLLTIGTLSEIVSQGIKTNVILCFNCQTKNILKLILTSCFTYKIVLS